MGIVIASLCTLHRKGSWLATFAILQRSRRQGVGMGTPAAAQQTLPVFLLRFLQVSVGLMSTGAPCHCKSLP